MLPSLLLRNVYETISDSRMYDKNATFYQAELFPLQISCSESQSLVILWRYVHRKIFLSWWFFRDAYETPLDSRMKCVQALIEDNTSRGQESAS